jgi:hypothetical protein
MNTQSEDEKVSDDIWFEEVEENVPLWKKKCIVCWKNIVDINNVILLILCQNL